MTDLPLTESEKSQQSCMKKQYSSLTPPYPNNNKQSDTQMGIQQIELN